MRASRRSTINCAAVISPGEVQVCTTDKPGRPSTAVSFELLVAGKEIADRMGGVERAKEALAERLR